VSGTHEARILDKLNLPTNQVGGWFGAMEQSHQSLKHLLLTLNRFVDQESACWMPLVPVVSQIESFKQRSDIIEWLTSLSEEFDFSEETLFLSVDIFDRFLHRITTPVRYLRCIAVTCLYLAAKVNEEDEMVPVTELIVERSQCGCSDKDVLRMERCILNKLDWALLPVPTSLQFIHLFDALIRTKCPSVDSSTPDSVRDRSIISHALTQCLPQLELLQCSPSTIALSTLSLYLQMTWIYWKPAVETLQAYARISDEKLSQCSQLIEGYVGAYLRQAVKQTSHSNLTQLSNNNNNTVASPVGQQSSHEEKMMEGLSVTSTVSNKTPYEPPSNPVTPDPPRQASQGRDGRRRLQRHQKSLRVGGIKVCDEVQRGDTSDELCRSCEINLCQPGASRWIISLHVPPAGRR